MERYETWLSSLARRLASAGEDTQDMIQQGRIALWDASLVYDPNKGASLTTFANQRVVGAMLKELKKTSSHTSLEQLLEADWDFPAEPDQQRYGPWWEAAMKLPEPAATIIRLIYDEEFSTGEVSRYMGISYNTIRKHHQNALLSLYYTRKKDGVPQYSPRLKTQRAWELRLVRKREDQKRRREADREHDRELQRKYRRDNPASVARKAARWNSSDKAKAAKARYNAKTKNIKR